MKNIKLLELEKYKEKSIFQFIENGIYRDLNDLDSTKYRITLSFELEEGEGQYPLEDILDKYYLYVSNFIKNKDDYDENYKDLTILEFAGELEDIKEVKNIIGKRVYNKFITKEDDKIYSELVIE